MKIISSGAECVWKGRWGKLFEEWGDDAEPIEDVELRGDYIRSWGKPLYADYVPWNDTIGYEAADAADEIVTWGELAHAHGIKGMLLPVGDTKAGDVVCIVNARQVREVEAALRESDEDVTVTLGSRKSADSLDDLEIGPGVREVDELENLRDIACDLLPEKYVLLGKGNEFKLGKKTGFKGLHFNNEKKEWSDCVNIKYENLDNETYYARSAAPTKEGEIGLFFDEINEILIFRMQPLLDEYGNVLWGNKCGAFAVALESKMKELAKEMDIELEVKW